LISSFKYGNNTNNEVQIGPYGPDVDIIINEVDVFKRNKRIKQDDKFDVTVKECVDLFRKWQTMGFETECTHTIKFMAKYENQDDVKGKWLENAFKAIFPEMAYEVSKDK